MENLGWTVFNPARHDVEMHGRGYFQSETGDMADIPDFDLAEAFRWDLNRILDADAIVMLSGWENSSGACHEKATAELVGKDVLYLTDEGLQVECHSA